VLLAATALSLFLANSFFAPGWCGLWGAAVGPALGGYHLSMQGWVNEGLMALFFFVLGLEAKREVCYGTLSNMKAAMLPCLAALGGLLVPVALFSMLNLGSQGLMQGWAIPVATDLAFAMAILGFFRNKMPQSAPTFLFAIATATNIAAVATIPAYFNSIVSIPYLTAAATLAVSMFLLPKLVKKVSAWMYAVGGAALWYCLLLSGASAGAAGVVAALAIPAAQLAPATSNAVGRQPGQTPTLIDHLIHNISPYTALIVLPMFALANTAVPVSTPLPTDLPSLPSLHHNDVHTPRSMASSPVCHVCADRCFAAWVLVC
jgi:NhaA family Na+:H+ antiporter